MTVERGPGANARVRSRPPAWRRPLPWCLAGWAVQAANVVLFGFSNAARFDRAEALEVATVIGAVGVLMWSFSIAFALRDLAGRREREAALSAAVASGTPLAVVTVLWFWARSVGLA